MRGELFDRLAHARWLLGLRIANGWRYRWGPRGIEYRARQRFGSWAEISGGTDCDGMRYAGVSFHWCWRDAQAALDASYDNAEGPHGGQVVSGREGREWEAGYVPDTRDRYAERMGY